MRCSSMNPLDDAEAQRDENILSRPSPPHLHPVSMVAYCRPPF